MSTPLELTFETHIILPVQLEWRDGCSAAAKRSRADELAQLGWQPVAGHDPDPIAASQCAPEQIARIHYQAYNYFHPFVRAFWFNDNIVQRLRHPALHTLKATLSTGERVTFDACCDLILFQPDIALLVLHLKCQTPLPLLTVETCLDQLRRIYPPYVATDSGKGHALRDVQLIDPSNKVFASYDAATHVDLQQRAATLMQSQDTDDRRRHIWAPHWAALLHGIATQPGDLYALQAFQLGDDRAALASLLSVQHATKQSRLIDQIDDGHMVRLCFADAAGTDTLPYSKVFLADFEARYCYDRFWYRSGESSDASSRILNCGYAFTWLGDGENTGFFADHNQGAPVIYRHIYVPMAIIAHFQKAALLVTARKLADLTPFKNGQLTPLDPQSFAQIKRHFMAFTQTYWFEEITPQQQGIELYDMYRRHLRLQAHYDANRQAIQDIVEHVDMEENSQLSKAAHHFNWIAMVFAFVSTVLAILSLSASLLGMNTFDINPKPTVEIAPEVLRWVNINLVSGIHQVTFTALGIASAIFVFGVVTIYRKKS